MAKVRAHTPLWLSRPSPGFTAFQPAAKPAPSGTLNGGLGRKIDHRGPLRTLAHRETEVFFVVDNEVRWADLVLLKEAGENDKSLKESVSGRGFMNGNEQGSEASLAQAHSRVLKTPVAGQIRQLVISPLGDYLAIVTSHTIHIAVLPRKIDTLSNEPIRPKTFQLGPTMHVLEQAPIASAIWHPLGALGTCLVTVATDACVRLWELDPQSRQSFTDPALAVDMKKLANAASYDEDMRASRCGTSKGFSPDQVEMEVAAACFGGIGTPDELGWAPMTLWVAMTEGDVYALCPLLPSKWQPSASTIPSLSTSVVSKAGILDQDRGASEEEKRRATHQRKWLQDIDDQTPAVVVLFGGLETVEIFQRPSQPPPVPKLQGPFSLNPEPDFAEISDIVAIAPRLEEGDFLDEDEFDNDPYGLGSGLSIGVICLLTRNGTIHVCLDTNGVEAMWLPSRRTVWETPKLSDDSHLLVIESIQLGNVKGEQWPAFTHGIADRYAAGNPLLDQESSASYSLYVTLSSGVYMCDLRTWTANLEDELSSPNDTGASFRVGLMYESDRTQVEQLIKIPSASPSTTAAISLLDSDLGHFTLTLSSNQPYSATLDLPVPADFASPYAPDAAPELIAASETREAYRPPAELYTPTSLPSFIETTLRSGTTRLKREDLRSQVRLSPATLQLLTESHRVIGAETSALSVAAADVFRRCQRMQAELAEQVRRVRELRDQVGSATDEGQAKAKIAARIKAVADREAKLQDRLAAVRRRLASSRGAGELSRKELAWAGEVKTVDEAVEGGLAGRVGAVAELVGRLKVQASALDTAAEEKETPDRGVPSELRRKKLEQVMMLLERESALVDAVSARLGRLSGLGGAGGI